MTTPRAVRDDVANALDYLLTAELAHAINSVAIYGSRVSWTAFDKSASFLLGRGHPDIDQFLAWVVAGAYSAILYDGSVIQVTYDVDGGRITRHRLAYLPCPYDSDLELLSLGEPLADVVERYRSREPVLRSPLRFDYDPASTSGAHSATHLTINSPDCRIPCTAPVHVLRFLDFVFRAFYPRLWTAHRPFFDQGATRRMGAKTLGEQDRVAMHLMWN
jgi:hypothetical protein